MSTQLQTPPTPDPSTVAAPRTPSESTRLLTRAEAEIQVGDLERAHETLCAAADAALDAVAEARGWHPDGGRLYPWEVVHKLDEVLGGIDLLLLFGSVEILEMFFHASRMDEFDVRWHAGRIGELVVRVEEMPAR